jgi:hypothetical protein
VKFNTAAELVPVTVTAAELPGGPVVTPPTLTLAAVPDGPVGPTLPAAASSAHTCGLVSGSADELGARAIYVEAGVP